MNSSNPTVYLLTCNRIFSGQDYAWPHAETSEAGSRYRAHAALSLVWNEAK